MFGSISVSRNRFQKPGSSRRPRARRVQREARAPSCHPSSCRAAPGASGATASITFAFSASLRSGSTPCARRVGPLHVAAVALRERPQRSGRVVHHLPPQVLLDVLAADADRRRGADVRLRRHREHVGGLADPDTRRGGAGAVRARRRRSPGSSTRARAGRSCASSPRARRACRARSRQRRSRRRSRGRSAGSGSRRHRVDVGRRSAPPGRVAVAGAAAPRRRRSAAARKASKTAVFTGVRIVFGRGSPTLSAKPTSGTVRPRPRS